MAKPYDMYQPGEVVRVTFYSTSDTSETVKLTETPRFDESSKEWIVIGLRRKTPTKFYDKPTKWWAHTISPAWFS